MFFLMILSVYASVGLPLLSYIIAIFSFSDYNLMDTQL